MAAGSVAAGGLYMQNELNQLKHKKLQEFGVKVQSTPDTPPRKNTRKNSSKRILPNM